MPPQVAARMASVATKSKTSAKSEKEQAAPAEVPSSAEKLGAHGAKVKHKRRFCRIEGCERIVKSQGLCQRHGAKPRLCKVKGCSKQAQGNFDGMCKSHFKEHKRKTTPIPKVEANPTPPQPSGASVYDAILPLSVEYFPAHATVKGKMPLVAHLAEGFHGGKPPAWHRNEERRARGLLSVENPATQLEGWERELVWMEILVLTGVPEVSFRHLARAWGRDKGFHMVLAQFICERHGDVQRKKRKREEEVDSDVHRKSAMAAPKRVARKPAMKSLPEPPQQFAKLGSTSEDRKALQLAMSTPEGRKKVALLQRKSSDKDSQSTGTGLSDDQLSLIGADAWDVTGYGDSNYNEALAADLFNLTPHESAVLMRRLSVGRPTGDDDSSSIYSRSVASGKTLGLLSRTESKDGQHQQTRLSRHDSNGSSRTSISAQIPNTVAVKKAPEPERNDQLDLSFNTDEPQKAQAQCLPPSHSQQQQQQYNGETGNQPQQQSPAAQDYQPHHPAAASSAQTNDMPHQSTQTLYDEITVSNDQRTQVQHYASGVPQAPEPTQQHYVQQQQASSQQQQHHAAQQQYQSPPLPPSQQQQQERPVQKYEQQYQPQQQAPLQQQLSPPPPPPQQQQQDQQFPQYGQTDYHGSPLQPQPQVLPQQQFQNNHQTHQHVPTQGQSLHQRQHSQQGQVLPPQPQIDTFQQPQPPSPRLSAPGHPLQVNQASGQGGQQHAQSLHQRQHSQQNLSLHGAPQVSNAYHQQVGDQSVGSHPVAARGQSFHHRQHSQQRYLLQGQTQVLHVAHQQPHRQNQTQRPPPQQTPVGHSNQNMIPSQAQHVPTLQQQQQQQPGTSSSQPFHVGYGGQNPPNAQFQPVPTGGQTDLRGSQPNRQGRLATAREQAASLKPPVRGMPNSRHESKESSQDLHDYDHRNEHLRAEEDDHMEVDPSHDNHDYGAEVEHEDHDHQDTQQQSQQSGSEYIDSRLSVVGGAMQEQLQSTGIQQESTMERHTPDATPGYAFQHPVQGHGTNGQPSPDQQQHQMQQWNQAPSSSTNTGQAAMAASYNHQSTLTQAHQGEHHHQHDHLGQAHYLEPPPPPPPQGMQQTYPSQTGVQQTPVPVHYQGSQQNQQQHPQQQFQEAQYDVSAQQNAHQPPHGYQQAAFQQQGVPQGHQGASHSPGFQHGGGQASGSGHQVPYQGQQEQEQQRQSPNGATGVQNFDQSSGQSVAYQHQPHVRNTGSVPGEGAVNGQFEGTSHQPSVPQQGHEDAENASMMNAFRHDMSSSVEYQQQHPGQAAFHQQTQPERPPEESAFASGFDSQQGAQHQQPQYQEQAQADHEAAKNAMIGFEQEQQHPGNAVTNEPGRNHPLQDYQQEALFELPYTRQPGDDPEGQQQSAYQQQAQTPVAADANYTQGLEEQSPPHQYEQQQQQQGQSNQDQYPLEAGQNFAAATAPGEQQRERKANKDERYDII